MITINLHNCDCLKGLRELPDQSVHCCVTSPPYWGLRDYKTNGQIGLELTLEEYVGKMVKVFQEVRRVLRDDGTLWLNLGDSYAGGGRGGNPADSPHQKQKTNAGSKVSPSPIPGNLKSKDLVGIPWMVAFALRADGWYFRSDIIWHKPNPMPESVRDRPTKAHEYIFLLSKSPRYYYDAEAIKEPAKESSIRRWGQNVDAQIGSDRVPGKRNGAMKAVGGPRRKSDKQRGHGRRHDGFNDRWDQMTKEEQCCRGANKRSVWTVSTKPFKEAHFATFPPELIEPCVLAGSREGDTILDPFAGSGTTAVVAARGFRNFVGFEINPGYCEIAWKRIEVITRQGRLF